MSEKIHFKVITHENVIYDDFVDEIYSKGTDGEFGVLANHIPFMCALDIGVTKVLKDSKCDCIATIGGMFQIKENEAIILTDEAQMGSDIDVPRAKNAYERASARLNSKNSDTDILRAEMALAKALARIKAGSFYSK